MSKIKRSTLNNGNSKQVNKEIETLKLTVSNLEDKITKMSCDFEAKMREMCNMMQQQSRQCNQCSCTNRSIKQEKIPIQQAQSSEPSQPQPQPPLPKRVKLVNHHSIIKQEYGPVEASAVTALPNLKESNFERQQSTQSTDFLVSLINDDSLDPSGDCGDISFSLESDQLLSFPERNNSTGTNALPPLPESLTRMPEIGIIRFLSDLSASRTTSLGEKISSRY